MKMRCLLELMCSCCTLDVALRGSDSLVARTLYVALVDFSRFWTGAKFEIPVGYQVARGVKSIAPSLEKRRHFLSRERRVFNHFGLFLTVLTVFEDSLFYPPYASFNELMERFGPEYLTRRVSLHGHFYSL